jgi:ring-1,2-phenylacetyl-CoA epoxidase subunit PaaE
MSAAREGAPAAPGAGVRALYVGFAAGADLAALVALLAARLREEPACEVVVFFGNYGDVSAAALEELLALKDCHLRRLALHFIMEREPEEGELLTGRLDAQKVRALAARFFAPLAVHEYFLLGGAAAVTELHAALVQLGVAPQRIRATAKSGAESAAPAQADAAASPAAGVTEVSVIRDGRRCTFTMQTGVESILEAAARAGLDLPFSCRAGVCSTCRTKLVRGEVELAQNYALEDWELAQGFILACQAHAKTAELEITYDEI